MWGDGTWRHPHSRLPVGRLPLRAWEFVVAEGQVLVCCVWAAGCCLCQRTALLRGVTFSFFTF